MNRYKTVGGDSERFTKDEVNNSVFSSSTSRVAMLPDKTYAELVTAGFRPPQVYLPDRATKRSRYRFEEISSDEDGDSDNNDNVIVRNRAIQDEQRKNYTIDVDLDSDQDVKPPAIEKNVVQSSDGDSPNIAQHRQHQSISTKRKVKSKYKTETTSSSNEQQPLQLFHRLFEPVGGRGKRKGIIINTDNNKIPKFDTTISKNNRSKDNKINNESTQDKERVTPDIDTTNHNNHCTKAKIELPLHAIIRGSITHKILKKLNRLDQKLLYDDPYAINNINDNKIGENENNDFKPSPPDSSAGMPILQVNNDIRTVEIEENTNLLSNVKCDPKHEVPEKRTDCKVAQPPNLNIDTGSIATTTIVETKTQKVHEPIRVCIRSTVIPQIIGKPSLESYRMVILQGPYQGRTGTLKC
jgi:hypothetical protein